MPAAQNESAATRECSVQGLPGRYLLIVRSSTNSRVQPLDDPHTPSLVVPTVSLYNITDREGYQPPAPGTVTVDARNRTYPCYLEKKQRYDRIEQLLLEWKAPSEVALAVSAEFGTALSTAHKDVSIVRQRMMTQSQRPAEEIKAEVAVGLIRLLSQKGTSTVNRLRTYELLIKMYGLAAPAQHVFSTANSPLTLNQANSPSFQHLLDANPDLLNKIAEVEAELAQLSPPPTPQSQPQESPSSPAVIEISPDDQIPQPGSPNAPSVL